MNLEKLFDSSPTLCDIVSNEEFEQIATSGNIKEEPIELPTIERVKKTRMIKKKVKRVNEKGYLVTEVIDEEESYYSEPDINADNFKKQNLTRKSKPAKQNKKGSQQQKSLHSFWGKKI